MTNTTEAHEAADALEVAVRKLGRAMTDANLVNTIKNERLGDVLLAHIRLSNLAHEITKGF